LLNRIIKYIKGKWPAVYLKLQKYYNIYYYNPKSMSRRLKKMIIEYYSSREITDEISEILNYLINHELDMFPYCWAHEVRTDLPQVHYDMEVQMPYVLMDQKRMYFPKGWEKWEIQANYNNMVKIEQHLSSPHRYLTNTFTVNQEDIVVDCGTAEGNFALDIVDQVKKLYLFEPDEIWIEPLTATFSPWMDKVTIVQKYLSDSTDETSITLDDYFKNKAYPTLIKLDVEGYEWRILTGANAILSSDECDKVVTCTYHFPDDEKILGQKLQSYGFNVEPSRGYLILTGGMQLTPYLRRGVIRCTKNRLHDS